MPRKPKKKIPEFRTEEQERQFWAEADSEEYLEWADARRLTLPDLKPSTKSISLRLPVALLANLKMLAHKQDVPYQSLLKIYLADRVAAELKRTSEVRT